LWILPLAAQTEMPVGFFRGIFAGSEGSASAGDLSVRRADNEVYVCHYDAHSYIERDHRHTTVPSLKPGEPLEVLADHKPGSSTCYARIVQVVDPEPERLRARTRPVSNVLGFTPKGDRAYAGLVLQVDQRSVTLRTRAGDQVLHLRPDTRYLNAGQRMDASGMTVNTRVFVRAGRDIYGNLEAYQVMWGAMLPDR
jgi:hypothetical protein